MMMNNKDKLYRPLQPCAMEMVSSSQHLTLTNSVLKTLLPKNLIGHWIPCAVYYSVLLFIVDTRM